MIPAVLLNDTSYNNHHGCNRVIINMQLFFRECGVDILYGNPLGSDWRNNDTFLLNLQKASVLIINGEGTIHHGSEKGRLLLESIPMAKNLGLKIFLINMTYQSNPESFIRCLRQVDFITVRESLSQKELKNIGLYSLLVPDFTFYSFDDSEPSNGNNKTLVSDSVHSILSLKLKKLTEKILGTEFFPIWVKNPNYLLWSRFSTKFIKLPSKLTIKKLFLYPKALISQFRLNSVLYNTTVEKHEDFISKISNSNALLCARFHLVCMTIQQRKKFIAIKSNTFKIEGLINDIGLSPKRLVTLDDIENSIEIANFTPEELENIDRYMAFSENQFDRMKEIVMKQISNIG